MTRAPLTVLLFAIAAATLAAQAPQRPPATFRAATRGISVDVSVRDGNSPVAGLGPSDFVVYDGNVKQTITAVSNGAVPLDATIFLGTNNQSAARQLESLSGDVRRITTLLRPGDRVRLLTLQNQVRDVFGWRDAGAAGSGMNVQVGGVQSLYDACFLAMMHRPDPDRRHLIVAVTDGVEFGSVVDSTTVRDAARRAEAVLHLVFVDSIVPEDQISANAGAGGQPLGNSGNVIPTLPGGGFLFLRASWFHVMPDEHGLERLQEAARLTGGTVRRGSSGETFLDSFRRALDDFRESYLLRYTAEGVPLEGWHDLRVEVTNGRKYTVRARKGYFGG